MLRTRNMQPSLWDSVLPEMCRRLPAELERVDVWLDDERFFGPFMAHFDLRIGRPSVPIETYLRLMFLNAATGWATSRCAARWQIRSRGGCSAGSTSTAASRTRRP